MSRAATALLLLLAASSSAIAPRVHAQPRRAQVIERVVAVVNDDAIYLSDLRQRSVPFLEQVMSAPTQVQRMTQIEQLYRQLLDQLIDEELIQQAARRMQVRVTSADVDRAIQNVRRQSGLSEADFWQAVRGQGLTEARYRTDVRRQLLRLKVLNNQMQGRASPSEADVRARYNQVLREANAGGCYVVSMRLFQIPEGATATEVAAARREAETARAALTSSSFGGTDLGRICEGELDPRLDEALGGLRIGQISEPVRGPNGFVILHVRERAQTTNIGSYEQMRPVIARQLVEDRMQRQERAFLARLHRDAVIDKRLHHELD